MKRGARGQRGEGGGPEWTVRSARRGAWEPPGPGEVGQPRRLGVHLPVRKVGAGAERFAWPPVSRLHVSSLRVMR